MPLPARRTGASRKRRRAAARMRERTRGSIQPAMRRSARDDLKVAEVRLGPHADPEADLTARHAALQIVHHECRLRGSVDEQPRVHAADLDLKARPDRKSTRLNSSHLV